MSHTRALGASGGAWRRARSLVVAACAAVTLTAAPLASAAPSSPVAATLDAPCEATQAGTLAGTPALPLVCVASNGRHVWLLAPDEVSRTAHARFVDWVRPYVQAPAAGANGFPVVTEPGFPGDVAAAVIAAMDATRVLRGEPGERAVVVLGTSGQFMYDRMHEVVAPYAANASDGERTTWEMENNAARWASIGQGTGHAGGLGGAPQVYFLYLNRAMGVDERTTPVEAVELVMREYLIHSPLLEEGRFDGDRNRGICWLGESTAWNVTMAVMEVLDYPGFDFASRWAHWVSDLAAIRPAFAPGLTPSEGLIGPQNGVNRYDMPCQFMGVGHTQGFLAREWLMATAGLSAYAAYAPTSQRSGDVRAAVGEATGVSWQRWVEQSDARTAALLAAYPAGHDSGFRIGPDGQPVQTVNQQVNGSGEPGSMGPQGYVPGPPGMPVATMMYRIKGGKILVTWMHGSGLSAPSQYQYRVRARGGVWGPWLTLGGEAREVTLESMSRRTSYRFELRAVSAGGVSRSSIATV